MTFLIEDSRIGLAAYTHKDDKDMYACWQDIETQKGYNGVFNQTFDEFIQYDIERFKFWVTVTDKQTSEKVGVLRLGLDELCPDLAIWIYPPYRNMGYGTQSFFWPFNISLNSIHIQKSQQAALRITATA